MSVEDFLDTNVFVYMLDDTDEVKRRRAGQLVRRSIETGKGCISFQVVQETLNVATKKLGFTAGRRGSASNRYAVAVLNPALAAAACSRFCCRKCM